MSIENLEALKALWGTDSPNSFGRQVYDVIVDEIVALDGRVEAIDISALTTAMDTLDTKIDALDTKIDALEARVEALEE